MIVVALPYFPKFKIHSCTIETTILLFIVLYYIIILHWYLTYLVLVDIPQRILNILFYYILQEVCFDHCFLRKYIWTHCCLVSAMVMVFNTTFNNISVMSSTVTFIVGGNRSIRIKQLTWRKSLTNCIT